MKQALLGLVFVALGEIVASTCPSTIIPLMVIKSQSPLEVGCSLECHSHPDCSSYLYQDCTTSWMDKVNSEFSGNCVLLADFHDSLSPPPGFNHRIALKRSDFITVYFDERHHGRADIAWAMGFNITLKVRNSTKYLKKIPRRRNPQEAELDCFLQGGILPMEDSEEVIEAMSKVVKDGFTPRMVSLVKEMKPNSSERHIAWTLGRKEWGEDENGATCSKYSVWPSTHFEARHLMVDPVRKTYEPIAFDQVDGIYCQFLGPNLATGKATLVSSSHPNFHQNNAVDGVISRAWSSKDSPSFRPDWIAVSLDMPRAITHILFVARMDCCGHRNKLVTAWIGSKAPPNQAALYYDDFTHCGVYPYQQETGYLSGITCRKIVVGQFVILENLLGDEPMQIEEIGVFGLDMGKL